MALVAGWALWSRTGSNTTTAAAQVTHFDVSLPRDVEPAPASSLAPTLSPDGRIVAMVGVRDGVRHVLFRRFDRPETTEIPDTVGANGAVFSPDGEHLAVLDASGRLTRISLADQQRKLLASGVELASSLTWSEAGIIFSRLGQLWVVSPNGGEPRPLSSGQLALSVSPTGTLLFTPAGFTDTRVVSVARDGTALALDLPSGRYANPRISPDVRRLLVESGGSVVEALDLARGTRARLASGALGTSFSTWNADGNRVVFRRFNTPFWAAGDGTGVTGFVPQGTVSDFPSSAGPDPDSFVALRVKPETSGDIFLMSISGAFAPKPLIVTPAYDGGAQLSPDGRWLLYQSDASGRAEIYMRRYPDLDRQWQVSDGGGIQVRWSRNMREIYYRSGRSLVAAAFNASGTEPVFGKPLTLFTDDYDFGAGASIANYDVTTEGRFIMIRRGTSGGRLRVVVNWTEELKRILASGGVH